MGHNDAFVVDAGPVFPIFQITPSRQKTSLLTSEKSENPQLLQNQDIFRGASVGVKYLNMRNFRLLGHIPHFLVDVEALFPFLFSLRKGSNQRSLKTSPLQPITAHYCFPGHILKPLTKKKTLKQDYSIWVILLIMPSTWGHFVFFLIALKQLHAASVSSNTTSAAAHCCFPKLIPQPCKI